jgi:Fur family ferric uptake transcriptional regulator
VAVCEVIQSPARRRIGLNDGPREMTVSHSPAPLEFDNPETVLNALRGRGRRISTARRVVVLKLFEAARPLRADEIAAGLDGRLPPLDLASVYRNLETLEELGIVRHLHAGHGPGRYVLAGAGEREYLACEGCDALVEADPRDLDAARAEIRERFGYEAHFAHFPIVGLCASCRGGDS